MDLLKCQEMVCAAIKNLKYIQRDMDGVKLMAKTFIDTMSEKLELVETEDIYIVIETELPVIRSRKRKILSGEKNNDEPITDPEIRYTVEVHNLILDNTIGSMEKKFSKNQILYTDFACLSPANFDDIKKKDLPSNALIELTNKIKQFDETITKDSLQN